MRRGLSPSARVSAHAHASVSAVPAHVRLWCSGWCVSVTGFSVTVCVHAVCVLVCVPALGSTGVGNNVPGECVHQKPYSAACGYCKGQRVNAVCLCL